MRFEEVPLRRVVRMVNGGTPTSEAENWGGDIAWATPVDVGQNHGGELHGTARTITEDGLRSGSAIVPAGSVLVSSRAPIGYVAQAAVPMAFNQGCKGLIPRELVAARFLAYALQHIGPAMAAAGTGTTFQEISGGGLAALTIPLPNTDEQRAIADFLDRETVQIDAMVDAQERLVALLEERRDSAIQRAVTKGLHPATDLRPTSELWIDSMPEHWSVAPIGYYFEVTLGKMLDASKPARADDSHLPYLRAANIQDRGLELGDVKEMPFGPEEQARLDIRAGDLMVVEGGAIGTAVLITTDMPGWSFQKTVNRVRSRGRASTAYLRYVIRTIRDRGLFDMSGNKSTIAHLTAEKLAATRIPLPSIEEQREIAAYLDDTTRRIDAMIAKTQESIALMKERRAALISAAVTGWIDVRTGIEQVERDLEEARV